jgi:serine/threonine protein kinase
MLNAVYNLHNIQGLAHLDLKPDNFVMLEDGTLILIDFGHSKVCDEYSVAKVGTDSYFPPEVRRIYDGFTDSYDPIAVDVFNLGMCFFMACFL